MEWIILEKELTEQTESPVHRKEGEPCRRVKTREHKHACERLGQGNLEEATALSVRLCSDCVVPAASRKGK